MLARRELGLEDLLALLVHRHHLLRLLLRLLSLLQQSKSKAVISVWNETEQRKQIKTCSIDVVVVVGTQVPGKW